MKLKVRHLKFSKSLGTEASKNCKSDRACTLSLSSSGPSRAMKKRSTLGRQSSSSSSSSWTSGGAAPARWLSLSLLMIMTPVAPRGGWWWPPGMGCERNATVSAGWCVNQTLPPPFSRAGGGGVCVLLLAASSMAHLTQLTCLCVRDLESYARSCSLVVRSRKEAIEQQGRPIDRSIVWATGLVGL